MRGLFAGVAVALSAVGLEGVVAGHIGNGEALRAVDLGAVVEAAGTGPGVFGDADTAVGVLVGGCEAHRDDSVVVALRLVAVHERAELGVDGFDRGVAEDPAAVGDGVAAHVHEHAAAGALDVPEPVCVGAVVAFELADVVDVAESTFVGELLGADVLGRKAEVLAVHEEDARFLARRDHPVALVEAEG